MSKGDAHYRWRWANIEHVREYGRKKSAERRARLGIGPRKPARPPEVVHALKIENLQRWRARNPVRVAAGNTATNANKRAKRHGITDKLTMLDVLALWDREPTCRDCGEGRGVDHIVPMRLGGTNRPDNLRTLCALCNSRRENAARILPPGHPNEERARRFREGQRRRHAAPSTGEASRTQLG